MASDVARPWTITSSRSCAISAGSQPKRIVAWACGSVSTANTEWPSRASEAARLAAVVDLATPPLWFEIAITFTRTHPFLIKALVHAFTSTSERRPYIQGKG